VVDAFLFAILAGPVLLAVAAILYALTRAPDRIQLATLALFVASVIYFTQAYELFKRGGPWEVWGVVLGLYSLAVYVCMAALALYFKRWAWRAALGVFVLHAALGLLYVPDARAKGIVGALTLAVYLLVGAVGLWALLHRGSQHAVTTGQPGEA
jgi:hypothetical protein